MESKNINNQSPKWYFNDWVIVVATLAVWPLGIILGVKSPGKYPYKKLVTGIGIFIGLILIAPALSKINTDDVSGLDPNSCNCEVKNGYGKKIIHADGPRDCIDLYGGEWIGYGGGCD